MFKSGFVTIIGEPNSGKSTLLNTLIKNKLSIVSFKKNTTRNQIKGIYNDNNSQIIFIDTPGFLFKKTKLDEQMQKRITNSLKDVDIILYLLPFWKEISIEYLKSIKFTKNKISKKYILLTKIDKAINQKQIVEKAIKIDSENLFDKIIPISSVKGKNVEHLISEIKKDLTDNVAYYDRNLSHEYSNEFYVSEIIREKILFKLKDEIPHNIFVKVEEINNKKKNIYINAEIILSREGFKKIIIGKNGEMIKKIGEMSRKELEKYYNKKIFLELFVKVKKDWQNRESIVKFI